MIPWQIFVTIKYNKQNVHLMTEHHFSLYNKLQMFVTIKETTFIKVGLETGFSLIASKCCSRKMAILDIEIVMHRRCYRINVAVHAPPPSS